MKLRFPLPLVWSSRPPAPKLPPPNRGGGRAACAKLIENVQWQGKNGSGRMGRLSRRGRAVSLRNYGRTANNSWAQRLPLRASPRLLKSGRESCSEYQIVVPSWLPSLWSRFLDLPWEPVLKSAIASLPDHGAIQNGELNWSGVVPVRSTGSSLLWLSINPADAGNQGRRGLAGGGRQNRASVAIAVRYWQIPYQKGYRIAMNRT